MLTGLLPDAADAAVFAAAVFVLNATPGVDFLLTVTRTLQGGAWAGAAAALGIAAGCVVHALAAAFGLAALLALHPQAFVALQWAGAAYLAWIGVGMLRQAWGRPALTPSAVTPAAAAGAASAPEPPWADAMRTPPPRPWHADVSAGLLTNVLNPKVALFFLAFLPQFVPAQSPHKTLSFLLLSGWFLLQGLLFLLGLVAVASGVARLRTPGWLGRLFKVLSGLLFVALAVRLLREKPLAA